MLCSQHNHCVGVNLGKADRLPAFAPPIRLPVPTQNLIFHAFTRLRSIVVDRKLAARSATAEPQRP